MSTEPFEHKELSKNTASQNKTMLEHRIKIEDEKIENTWICCSGSSIDRRGVLFGVRTVIVCGVIVFCINRLVVLPLCDANQFLGLLTFLVGLIIPSPING
jgi:hypothetical protein